MNNPFIERAAEIVRSRRSGGEQYVFRFANGHGASVVQGPYTYGGPEGLWELAVVTWGTDDKGHDDFEIDYSTPITEDVLGRLTVERVRETLTAIAELVSV